MADDLLSGRLMSDYMQLGWPRHLPQCALAIFQAVVILQHDGVPGELSDQPIGSHAGDMLASLGGLRAGVFEEQERDLREYPDDPEAVELLSDSREQLTAYAAHYDMRVPTFAELVELMLRIGVLQRVEEDGEVWWRPADPLPLPAERLPLTSEEAASEDATRWQRVHFENAQAVIRLFWKEELDILETSLAGLAVRLDIDDLSAREAVLVLLSEGDFSTAADIERIPTSEVFVLKVDWDAFGENRIGVSIDPD
ncbi:MAG: hypothetical protein QOH16_3884 [Gaiellaceae bacterium]|nr:hypothetical protein [Gaiellaceae bacterium]